MKCRLSFSQCKKILQLQLQLQASCFSQSCVFGTCLQHTKQTSWENDQRPPNWPPRNMITARCDHKQWDGRPQTISKILMVENLHLLFSQDVNTVHINHFKSLWVWIYEASYKKYWNQLVDHLLHPNSSTPLPECSEEAWCPHPFTQSPMLLRLLDSHRENPQWDILAQNWCICQRSHQKDAPSAGHQNCTMHPTESIVGSQVLVCRQPPPMSLLSTFPHMVLIVCVEFQKVYELPSISQLQLTAANWSHL